MAHLGLIVRPISEDTSPKRLINSYDEIGYTWIDMIDAINHWQDWPPGWYESWDGTIEDIDEIRCDGVVEFSYEENEVMVSNFGNIALAGNGNLTHHNNLHLGDYDLLELCPMIQAHLENHDEGHLMTELVPL